MQADSTSADSFSKRYERYLPIMQWLVEASEFELDAAKDACPKEQPAFVTRVVNELVQQGWLVREDGAAAYRWNDGRGTFSTTRWLDDKMFGSQIKAGPEGDRPRERLLHHGASALKTSELIAILIRSGRPGESAVTAGQKLARAFDGKLDRLPDGGRGELKSISPAIEKTAYCQIMAGIELGRRVAAVADNHETTKICSPQEAMAFCQKRFTRLITDAKQEEFHIVTLDTKNQVIDTHCITIGTLDASLVHPREVFRPAIKDAAAAVILTHNHPSGDPTPSREDHQVTDRLTEAGKLIGIDVLDHIVLGQAKSVSIREVG